ncbi:hypothetical protein DFQ09_10323 [Winogradskyella pacifica]|uniref:Uncharacterized protein n=2 Tax=Winogradskyella pacifica TaxID=664642 RepID=A0A3D9MX75_9FLAO|nr:hypothetical protein DFQ09_10323 [Winogradskyella pacifica]
MYDLRTIIYFMFKISNYLNQLGVLKSIFLFERLTKKVTHLYCIGHFNNEPFLDSDQLLDYISTKKIHNYNGLKEMWNLATTLQFLYEDSLKNMEKKERTVDVKLAFDYCYREDDNILYDFIIYKINSTYVTDVITNEYEEFQESEIPYKFILLKEIILKCKKICYNLEMLYPEFKNEKISNIYKNTYAIHNPHSNFHSILFSFNQFQFLDLNNMEVLYPVKTVLDRFSKTEHVREQELYNQFFVGNAITKFLKCLKEFQINDKSRSDMKFIYEKMKEEGLIHSTVKQSDFLKWLSITYNINIEKTNNFNPTKKRLNSYSNC